MNRAFQILSRSYDIRCGRILTKHTIQSPKENAMKKTPLILFMTVPYLVFALDAIIPLACGSLTADAVEMISILTFLVCFPLMVISTIVYGVLMRTVGLTTEQGLFWAMLLKLTNIPLFLAISALVVLFMAMLFSAPLGIVLALSSYLLIIPTSIIAQFAFVRAKKDGLLSTGETALASIGLWFVVFDVISVITIYATTKNRSTNSPPIQL